MEETGQMGYGTHVDQLVQFGTLLESHSPGAPVFQQIVDALVSRMRSGALPAGSKLPPTRALARVLGTHRNTVVHAYQVLADAGLISSHVGRGSYVLGTDGRTATHANGPTARSDSPTANAGLPWHSLMSRAAQSETLARAERERPAHVVQSDTVDLFRFAPDESLRPHEAFRTCIDFVLRKYGAKVLGYAPREGALELREAISAEVSRRGISTRPDEILITSGSQQAIDLVVRALLDPNDTLLVEDPTYTGLLNLVSVTGGHPLGVACDEEGPIVEALEQTLRHRPKGFYLMPNGSNPTGRTTSAQRRVDIARFSQRSGIPLLEDDYCGDMYLESPPPPAIRSYDGQVLYMSTFSKKLMPALRTGFLIAPRTLKLQLLPLRHAMDLGGSHLIQRALAEFIDRGYLKAHEQRMRAVYRERRDAVLSALRSYMPPSVRWAHPTVGVLLWLTLPKEAPASLVAERARSRGVLVSGGAAHSVGGKDTSGLRLTYCAEEPERLRLGIRRLSEAIGELLDESKRSSRIAQSGTE